MTDKKQRQRLLGLVFELEGMIRLSMDRDEDKMLDERISSKIAEINAIFPSDASSHQDKAEPADESDDDLFYSLPDEPVIQTEEDEPQSGCGEDSAQAGDPSPRKKPLLSINDRFRFKRELFGGSETEFNDTLGMIATMDSLPEAEEYLTATLEWDPEDEVVKEFMNILERYFKK